MQSQDPQVILTVKQTQLRARELQLIELKEALSLVDSAARKLAPWVFQSEALSPSLQTTLALLRDAVERQQELVTVKANECAELWESMK